MTMTMKSSLVLASTLLLGVACDPKQDLGGTATDGSTGGDSAEGSDTAPPDDTGLPSGMTESTSGTSVGETGMPTDTTTTTSPTEDTGITEPETESETDPTGTETGDPPSECVPSENVLEWTGNAQTLRDAIGASGSGVAVGECSLTIGEPGESKQGTLVELSLSCTMSGEANAEPFADAAVDFDISLLTTYDVETLFAAFGDTVVARIVTTGNFNPDNGAWLVLEQPLLDDNGYPLLILGNGQQVVPEDSMYSDYFAEDWLRGPSITSTDASCGLDVSSGCSDVPIALEAGWVDRSPIVVHAGETDSFSSAFEGLRYHLHPREMWEVSQQRCADFPGFHVNYLAVAMEE